MSKTKRDACATARTDLPKPNISGSDCCRQELAVGFYWGEMYSFCHLVLTWRQSLGWQGAWPVCWWQGHQVFAVKQVMPELAIGETKLPLLIMLFSLTWLLCGICVSPWPTHHGWLGVENLLSVCGVCGKLWLILLRLIVRDTSRQFYELHGLFVSLQRTCVSKIWKSEFSSWNCWALTRG